MKESELNKWSAPEIDDFRTVPTGDMPGDQVVISQSHVDKAKSIMPELLNRIEPILKDEDQKVVIAVYGGSGVGKSETASLLAYYLNIFGIGSYVLSGDNYPRRIPHYNDAERLRLFRTTAIKGLVDSNLFDGGVKKVLNALQVSGEDANPEAQKDFPWLKTYQEAGTKGLSQYLGSIAEIDFDELNGIIEQFKAGQNQIMLKRMGREESELWYDRVDFSKVKVLVIEWTLGSSDYLMGVDLPIMLNSTPQETLAHRKLRNRDGGTDSHFTNMVLKIEQEAMHKRAHKAKIIVSKSGGLLSYRDYLMSMNESKVKAGVMLNAYPDSMGATLKGLTECLELPEFDGVFSSFYILPSLFHTDLDRGFSVIDYNLNDSLAKKADLDYLKGLGIDFKFDFILNHASVLSKQFQDIIEKGQASEYKDFFINWNKFWDGNGTMTDEGYIQPDSELIESMFFRKPGLPILMVRFPDGREVPYWNTFYQEVAYEPVGIQELMKALNIQYERAGRLVEVINTELLDGKTPTDIDFGDNLVLRDEVIALLESKRQYLGQMDLNIKSPLVWEFYEDTLKKLAGYGAQIVRLDAFAYAPKEPGEKNFLNEPGTWEVLSRVQTLAEQYGLSLLPEIHSRYDEKIHEKLTNEGHMTYDFFLPGLIIDAIERKTSEALLRWINDIEEKGLKTVNMLGCHDGIPLLDLKGLLKDEQIEDLIELVVSRGGHVKDLHGKKNMYYQVNATYYSALGEDDQRLLLARAIQMFMPGKPQVWYLDLFAGKNDYKAVDKAGSGGHKEINRTNMTLEEVHKALEKDVVKDQLALMRFRNTYPAFGFDAKLSVTKDSDSKLKIAWENKGCIAKLKLDFADNSFSIQTSDANGIEFVM